MTISDVRVRKLNADGKMRAIVSVTFDDALVVHDIKVIEGQKGLFVAMPSRKMNNGEFKDVAHPINKQMREEMEQRVLEAYAQAAAGMQPVDAIEE
nr:septation regulator SpoVG [Maliibacterium massiliense]